MVYVRIDGQIHRVETRPVARRIIAEARAEGKDAVLLTAMDPDVRIARAGGVFPATIRPRRSKHYYASTVDRGTTWCHRFDSADEAIAFVASEQAAGRSARMLKCSHRLARLARYGGEFPAVVSV